MKVEIDSQADLQEEKHSIEKIQMERHADSCDQKYL